MLFHCGTIGRGIRLRGGSCVIVDTHLHVIDQSVLEYPWLAGVPALNRPWSYETYALEARRARHLADAAYGGRRRPRADRRRDSLCRQARATCPAVWWSAPSPPAGRKTQGFASYLERQRQNPLVKGFRRVLHVMPDELSEQPLFRENIAAHGRQRPDLRSLRPAAPDEAGDGPRRSRARCAVRPRSLRRARHQGRRPTALARQCCARSRNVRT